MATVEQDEPSVKPVIKYVMVKCEDKGMVSMVFTGKTYETGICPQCKCETSDKRCRTMPVYKHHTDCDCPTCEWEAAHW